MTRDDLADAYRALGELDVVQAAAVVLEYSRRARAADCWWPACGGRHVAGELCASCPHRARARRDATTPPT